MKSGRDQMVIDPDPDEIYTRRKKRIVNVMMSSTPSSSPSVKYPNDGWGNSLERMPSFTRAEMNQHITNSGKKVASIQHHSIPTNLKKAKTFLTGQYLKDIEATSGQRHFYLPSSLCLFVFFFLAINNITPIEYRKLPTPSGDL